MLSSLAVAGRQNQRTRSQSRVGLALDITAVATKRKNIIHTRECHSHRRPRYELQRSYVFVNRVWQAWVLTYHLTWHYYIHGRDGHSVITGSSIELLSPTHPTHANVLEPWYRAEVPGSAPVLVWPLGRNRLVSRIETWGVAAHDARYSASVLPAAVSGRFCLVEIFWVMKPT